MDASQDTEMGEAKSSGDDPVKDLLGHALSLVNEGKPSQALKAVLMALKMSRGDAAVAESLQRARELYRSKLQESRNADQLAALFAECVIADVQSSDQVSASTSPSLQNSILAESEREQIARDAFADGSSFICLQCGGLVSVHRKDEHYSFWCVKI